MSKAVEKKPPKYPPKVRAKNQPENEIGQKRSELYTNAHSQMKKAWENGFYIEVIAIAESMISDRLEARIAYLANHEEAESVFRTLGTNIRQLKEFENRESPTRQLLPRIKKWENERNIAIHEIVKLRRDQIDRDWLSRTNRIREAAIEGRELARLVSNSIKKKTK